MESALRLVGLDHESRKRRRKHRIAKQSEKREIYDRAEGLINSAKRFNSIPLLPPFTPGDLLELWVGRRSECHLEIAEPMGESVVRLANYYLHPDDRQLGWHYPSCMDLFEVAAGFMSKGGEFTGTPRTIIKGSALALTRTEKVLYLPPVSQIKLVISGFYGPPFMFTP